MLRISEYVAVAFAATLKFVAGPIAGIAFRLNWWETALSSAFGMMITVISVLYGGHGLLLIIKYLRGGKKGKVFSRTTRFAVKVKSKLGLWGVAILTPFIFTPVLGSFIALHFKYNKVEIIWKMFLCALFAGATQTLAIQFIRDLFF